MGYGLSCFLWGVFVGCCITMIAGYCLIKYDERKERKRGSK